MAQISNLEIGYIILAVRYGKKIKGKITKILPGAVIIDSNGNTRVIDADRIIKTLKKSK